MVCIKCLKFAFEFPSITPFALRFSDSCAIDLQNSRESLDSCESFQGSRTEPFFLANRESLARYENRAFFRTPQSAHHPHKSHDEHRQCNPGGGIHLAVFLGSDNLCTTPFEFRNPFFDPKSFVVAVYGWWSPIFLRIDSRESPQFALRIAGPSKPLCDVLSETPAIFYKFG